MRMPLLARWWFTASSTAPPRSCVSSRWRNRQTHGLVRRRSTAKINAHKAPQRSRIIERLFYTWVRQVKPLLHEVSPQHHHETHRTPPVTRLRVCDSTNNSRRDCRPYFSSPACAASVCCRIAFRLRLPLYPTTVWKADLFRDSLDAFHR